MRRNIAFDVFGKPNLDLLVKFTASEEQLRIVCHRQSVNCILMFKERCYKAAWGTPDFKPSIYLSHLIVVFGI